jgi:hypothetical protein
MICFASSGRLISIAHTRGLPGALRLMATVVKVTGLSPAHPFACQSFVLQRTTSRAISRKGSSQLRLEDETELTSYPMKNWVRIAIVIYPLRTVANRAIGFVRGCVRVRYQDPEWRTGCTRLELSLRGMAIITSYHFVRNTNRSWRQSTRDNNLLSVIAGPRDKPMRKNWCLCLQYMWRHKWSDLLKMFLLS